MHRLDQLWPKQPAKLLDYKTLTLDADLDRLFLPNRRSALRPRRIAIGSFL